MDEQFIRDKVQDFDVVVGLKEPEKPPLLYFENYWIALDMLRKHINNRSNIRVHADVDVDGIGSAYIVQSFLNDYGCVGKVKASINKEKEHGIVDKHVKFFNNSGCDLLIIVDASSNDIEIIKQLNCDVLVIDHHIVGHSELTGNTLQGSYIIVNNMVSSSDGRYIADANMSGAMVVYELFRHFEQLFPLGNGSVLEARLLYQWVGVTLLSDAIRTASNRNQWYMHNTVHAEVIEPNLSIMLRKLTKYERYLSKSFISFTLAPLFNKTIRAGMSSQALAVALGHPDGVLDLKVYSDIQKEIVAKALDNVEEYSDFCFRNLEIDNIHKNYAGLIANKVLETTKKTTIACRKIDDTYTGSFRGKISSIDYRQALENCGYFARGHETAFGIKIPSNKLEELNSLIVQLENGYSYRPYVTFGSIKSKYKGVHHIEDFESFRRDGWLWKIGMANSTLSNDEQILITMDTRYLKETDVKENYRLYNWGVLSCMAFEEIDTPYCNVYAEYGSELRLFIRKELNLL